VLAVHVFTASISMLKGNSFCMRLLEGQLQHSTITDWCRERERERERERDRTPMRRQDVQGDSCSGEL